MCDKLFTRIFHYRTYFAQVPFSVTEVILIFSNRGQKYAKRNKLIEEKKKGFGEER